ncbi:MAG: hypothetical protein IPP81_19140 [Chitinophagaceae bacterium]|nr:hypothetical protein [Chitinophagaceae bacterium]
MKNKLLPFALTIGILTLLSCNNKTEKSNATTTDTVTVAKVTDSVESGGQQNSR